MKKNEEWAESVGSTAVPPSSVRPYQPGTRGFARPSSPSPPNANNAARAAANAAAAPQLPVFGRPPTAKALPHPEEVDYNDPEKGGRRKNIKKSRRSMKKIKRKHRKTMKKRKN